MRRNTLMALFTCVVLTAFPSMVLADSAILHWQANTESDLDGYRVYYGVQSRSYGPYIPIGKTVTSYTLNGLVAGRTYYFALTAVDTSGNESGYSTEVSKIISATSSTSGSETGCDADHLDLCQSEAECNEAGGYIAIASDGTSACMAVEKVPTNQETPVNLMTSMSLMQSAPVALADSAAEDGTITPGEKMRLQFRVPGYEGPVDVYAAIQFPDTGNQLFYFQDNATMPLTAQFKALKRNFTGPLNKMIYPDFDACGVFGSAYNGEWSVYYLIIPAQGRTFGTADALVSYIEKNNVPQRYEWYRFELQCGSAQ
jgi:hypothetical protein